MNRRLHLMRGWCWSVGAGRALLETLFVYVLLLLGLWSLLGDLSARVVLQGYLFVCMGCAGICALRLRLPRPVRRVWRDALIAALLAVIFAGFGAFGIGQLEKFDQQFLAFPLVGKFLILAFSASAFAVARIGAYLWVIWNKLRREHLIWSLTHAHIAAVLLLLALAGGIPAAFSLVRLTGFFKSAQSMSASASNIAFLVVTILVWLSVFAVFAVLAIAVIILPSAIFSFIVTRTMTRRLKALAEATHAVRQKDYSARVIVRGQDEIAQLQSDFNAMAAEMEHAMTDLRTEHNTVSQLLETRRNLAVSVSHELRTPLATLRASLETALEHDTPSTLHEMEVMHRDVLRLQGLVDDLFALSRAEVGQLTLRCVPTDLGKVVRRVVESVAPLAWRSSRIEVSVEVAPALPLADIDAGRVEQILHNLLHNSLRYTPLGGVITVSACVDGCAAVIDVWDTGAGIHADDLHHIWEPYYRAGNTSSDGAGVGLALVKQLTEAMHGVVAVESNPGMGTRFTLRFPLTAS